MTTGLVSQHQLASYANPQAGQSGTASIVLGNDNTTVTGYNTHDADATIHLQSSAFASRPAAAAAGAGAKWMSYDTGPATVRLFYTDGSAWTEFNYIGVAVTLVGGFTASAASTIAMAGGPNAILTILGTSSNPKLAIDATAGTTSSSVQFSRGGVAKWSVGRGQQGGDDNFYIRDEVNSAVAISIVAGASPALTFGGKVTIIAGSQLQLGTTASAAVSAPSTHKIAIVDAAGVTYNALVTT